MNLNRLTEMEQQIAQARADRLRLTYEINLPQAKAEVAIMGLPSVAVPFAVALLASEQTVTFSENGSDAEQSVAILFRDFLTALKTPTLTPAQEAVQKLEKLTQAHMDKHKVGYSVAFKAVCAANKELAGEVRTFSRQ